MNNFKIIKNLKYGEIRTVTINGTMWFVAQDVGRCLECLSVKYMLKKYIDDIEKRKAKCNTNSGVQTMVVVNISAIHKIVLHSKFKDAKKVEKWIISEMLPNINEEERGDKMNNLQVMNNKELTIDSREVAEMMGVEHADILKKLEGTQHKDGRVKQVGIIPTLNKGNFPLVKYFIESTYKDAKGEKRKCYLFTKMGCEFIANKFNGEKGILFTAKYVEKFNQMEKNQTDSYLIQDPIERAKAWIKEQEEKKLLQEKIQEQQPKVLFADTVTATNTLLLVREVAKLASDEGLKIGEKRLWNKLREWGLIFKNSTEPKQYAIDNGWFKVVEGTKNSGTASFAYKTTKVTGKGQVYIISKLKKEVNPAMLANGIMGIQG